VLLTNFAAVSSYVLNNRGEGDKTVCLPAEIFRGGIFMPPLPIESVPASIMLPVLVTYRTTGLRTFSYIDCTCIVCTLILTKCQKTHKTL